MIKVTVLYRNSEDKKFDMEYFCGTHIPMVQRKFGGAFRRVQIDEGLAGQSPDSQAPFVAIAHWFFDSIDAFQGAFGPNADTILGDIPNFTNIKPTVQISAVRA